MVNFNFHEGYFVDTKVSDESNKKLSSVFLNSNDLIGKTELTTTSISYLVLKKVEFSHAGNYTCAPSNLKATSVFVHVLKGKLNLKKSPRRANFLIFWEKVSYIGKT